MTVEADVCDTCGRVVLIENTGSGMTALGAYHVAPRGFRTVRCRGQARRVQLADLDTAPIPGLAGVAEAAEILGVSKAGGLQRLRDAERMPEPVAMLRTGPIYRRAELELLATTLRSERADREERRAAREAASVAA